MLWRDRRGDADRNSIPVHSEEGEQPLSGATPALVRSVVASTQLVHMEPYSVSVTGGQQ